MARVLRLLPGQQRIEAHDVDNGVECEHKVVTDNAGNDLLHLSTFGSKKRDSKRKSSQSLQIDTKIAAQLIDVLRDAFGDAALNVRPRLDIAFPPGTTVDTGLLEAAYHHDPELFRSIISNDVTRGDVVAMANRRSQVERFESLLNDATYFSSEQKRLNISTDEALWQAFFEENPWIFGVSLTGQLLTSWDEQKLEQVVAGSSVSGPGKRVDALLLTTGLISSLVFAEIKTHKTPLLGKEYRSGCWSPSRDVAGAVAQVQGTTYLAAREIGDRLQRTAVDNSDIPGEFGYALRPRSYLVVGNLSTLRGAEGGDHLDKIRSFELFRSELIRPEILTFDEVLARAKWIVESTGGKSRAASF